MPTLASYLTLSFHLALVFALVIFCVSWLHIFVFLASSIPSRCPIHLRRWSSIKAQMLISLYNSLSSTFIRVVHWLSSVTSLKIVLNIFLSKDISIFSFGLFITHVSALLVTAGLPSYLWYCWINYRYIHRENHCKHAGMYLFSDQASGHISCIRNSTEYWTQMDSKLNGLTYPPIMHITYMWLTTCYSRRWKCP